MHHSLEWESYKTRNLYKWDLSFFRYALNEMDKFSLKDSGRGDSEAGDSDCEMGRESPLLGEGFGEVFTPDGQHRPHPGKERDDFSHYFKYLEATSAAVQCVSIY